MAKKAETTAKAEKKVTEKKTKTVKVEEPKIEEAEETFVITVETTEDEPVELEKTVTVEEPKTVEETIEAVNTDLDFEIGNEELEQAAEEELKEIEDVVSGVKEIEKSEENLDKILNEEPEKAEELIKEEIENAQKLKNKIDKIINKPRVKPLNVTSWWNGMGYDF